MWHLLTSQYWATTDAVVLSQPLPVTTRWQAGANARCATRHERGRKELAAAAACKHKLLMFVTATCSSCTTIQ
jgi:hypothetical protein